MKDTQASIKKVMIVFAFLLLALITYIAYFQAFKAPAIAEKPENQRLWAERNKVLRGTIYDRNMTALTESKKTGTLTQERKYVYGSLYSHVLGYSNEKYGLSGLEYLYDKDLRSYDKISASINSVLNKLNIKEVFNNRTSQGEEAIGNSLVTSLDTNIQTTAWQALGNRKGAVVVLDPKTGEIVASVSNPAFDPNNLDKAMQTANSGASSGFPLINRAVSGMYAPGSTFKIVTLTSALENIPGVTSRTFQDNGKIDFPDGSKLWNLNHNVYGSLSLKTALAYSSNVVFGTLAMELGNDKLKKTAEDFGFNKSLPSDGIAFNKSAFPTLNSSEKGSIAQTGIGQSSILASPLQMALVVSAVANNGIMMEPKLVNKVVDKNGKTVREIQSKQIANPISSGDDAIIKDYMKSLVDGRINRDWGVFKGLNAAGKTGTAETSDANADPHSWFIGFAPVDNPKYAIAVIVENGGAGGGVAAQIAGSVLKASLGQ
ncbi:peptidoglycan D,D-transpeptidase FtsI family protein [Clostridium paridis]|uniref:Penicillin-binding protein 2 n=1 Tax=Clostridium paridis TaxID=2803863 RepID=A0A937FGJ8_9CLOT|nr:penicillin-binding transpeptidase domain-containing protein [Clostridium paridis]MBL4931552.1 penicillin-binding protein 2 [Clostridium paridis]